MIAKRAGVLVLVVMPALAQTKDYRTELGAASNDIITKESIVISKIDLGTAQHGENRFTARIKNNSQQPVTVLLDLRADPGLWLKKYQSQFLFLTGAGQEREIQANYQFERMSAEAFLRVRFAFPEVQQDGVTTIGVPFYERSFQVGVANPSIDYNLSFFEKRDTDHFSIYYFPSSLAAKDIDSIVKEREAAYKRILELLAVRYPGRVRIFLFPDAAMKTKETGHTGAGWAFRNNIVEVYNDTTRLDPFHELAHILANQLGEPPALFNEGFAVYTSELMGGDALKYLASPGIRLDEAVAMHRAQSKFIPLEELLRDSEFGSDASRAEIAYPEAGSAVKYLIEHFGVQKFRSAYQSLISGSPAAASNREAVRRIYGRSIAEIEADWLKTLPPRK